MIKFIFKIVHFFLNLYYSARMSFFGVVKAVHGKVKYNKNFKVKRRFRWFTLVSETFSDGIEEHVYEYMVLSIPILHGGSCVSYIREVPVVGVRYGDGYGTEYNMKNGNVYLEYDKRCIKKYDIDGKIMYYKDKETDFEEWYDCNGLVVKKIEFVDGLMVMIENNGPENVIIRQIDNDIFSKRVVNGSYVRIVKCVRGNFSRFDEYGEYEIYIDGDLVENGSVKYGKYDGIVKKKVGDDWIKMYYIHDDLICSEFVKENDNVSQK